MDDVLMVPMDCRVLNRAGRAVDAAGLTTVRQAIAARIFRAGHGYLLGWRDGALSLRLTKAAETVLGEVAAIAANDAESPADRTARCLAALDAAGFSVRRLES